VLHCPYCHGWEVRDQPLAVLALSPKDVLMAGRLARGFSDDVVLCTGGTYHLSSDEQQMLDTVGVSIRSEPITRLEADGGQLGRIIFADSQLLQRHAIFFHPPFRQHSELPRRLGCRLLDDGAVEVDAVGHTSVTGVFAVGDMARRPDMPTIGAQVAIAAAEGVAAAITIDQELVFEIG
jgi:thioredoxin reductase